MRSLKEAVLSGGCGRTIVVLYGLLCQRRQFDALSDHFFDAFLQYGGSCFKVLPQAGAPEGILVQSFLHGLRPEVEHRQVGGVIPLAEGCGETAGDKDHTDGGFGLKSIAYNAALGFRQ